MQENKEHIKTRMLKNAARAWGYSESEAESHFDPLVSMLLGACASELEKISGEIHGSRARVLERLVQILSPDVLTGALPAHAIASAIPIEGQTALQPDTQFHMHKRLPVLKEDEVPVLQDIFFSPTAAFRLNRASIRFIATGNQLYSINQTSNKQLISQGHPSKQLPASTIWLAIDEPGVSLHQTSFYFDFHDEANRHLFFHQLPKSTWHIDGELLQHVPGYGNRGISGEQLDLNAILNREDDVSGRIRCRINAYYKPHFITLLDEEGLTAVKNTNDFPPAAISQAFGEKECKLLHKQPLRWITIRFPESVSNRLLQEALCVMNCFPVMNSRLHDYTYRLQETTNIIALRSDEFFLDLEQVSDDEGRSLTIRSVGRHEEDSIAVLMRNGGVGRFDERDASAIVDYTLQLLRDESAAFSALGNDFMNNEMKQLKQIINKLEQRLTTSAVHPGQSPYLIIRNNDKDKWHNLYIRFQSTNGKEGNNIKAGTALQLYKGGSLQTNQAVLVTTTCGGRNMLGITETVLAYKMALLSGDRLITSADIKVFCHYQMGDKVKNVDVRKGVMVPAGQDQGFLRTIDVIISIHQKAYEAMVESGELYFWRNSLKVLLEEKSSAMMPFRVFIQQD